MKGRVAAIALAVLAAAGEARADAETHARFRTTMDSVFGSGAWRITGGYRTEARENALRAQGALTVAPGRISRHSTGTREHPGAYDVVVDGLDPFRAAAKLRRANAPFRTVFPKGRHGTQGAHLHIDPYPGGVMRSFRGAPGLNWVVANPTRAQIALAELRGRAVQGDVAAQMALGDYHSQGSGGAPRSLVEAYVWTASAAANVSASPELRAEAERALAGLDARMTPDERLDARQFAPAPGAPAAGFAYGPVVARRRAEEGVRVAQAGGPLIAIATQQPACSAQASCALGGRELSPVR